MSGTDRTDLGPVRSMLADVVANPAAGRRSLPRLVGMLEAEDRTVRIGAAGAICMVASADPDIVDYVVRRLVDRLDDDNARAETILALEYLTTQFPKTVDETLQELREEREDEPIRYTRQRGFLRSDYLQPSGGERSGVGRLQTPGEGTPVGTGLVYDSTKADQGSGGPAGTGTGAETEPADDPEPSAEETGGAMGEDDQASESGTESDREQISRLYERISSIVDGSVFEELLILTGLSNGRFADRYRVLAARAGQEEAVSLRLFHEPADSREPFRSALAEVLDQWESLEASDNVVTLYDSGMDPQPWAATQHTDATLTTDEVAWTPGDAIRAVEGLADGLSSLHNRGIVHAGIDPESVTLDLDVRGPVARTAKLDNVGLLTVFRWHVQPSTCLDPRFAAPEYFDASFGPVDQASDIYQLGGVLYYLLTGEPPYNESEDELREAVRSQSRSPPPSTLDSGVPSAIDDVVSKAMAPQKLTRYETALAFRQDLQNVREAIQ